MELNTETYNPYGNNDMADDGTRSATCDNMEDEQPKATISCVTHKLTFFITISLDIPRNV
jgi:hypothetical protein